MTSNKKEYNLNYRIINKQIISNKKKIYRLKNKNHILELKKLKIKCECGLIIAKNSYYKHIKRSKHIKNINKIVDSFIL